MDEHSPEANQLDCRVYTFVSVVVFHGGFYCSGQSCIIRTQQSVRISDARKRAARIRFPIREYTDEVLFLFFFLYYFILRYIGVCVCEFKSF